MNIVEAQVCQCRRPVASGRLYYGYEACVGCGQFVVGKAEKRRLEREEKERGKRHRETVRETPRFWEAHVEQLKAKGAIE